MDPASVSISEVTPADGPQYFGSGKAAALSLASRDPALTPAEIIKAVIVGGREPSVGGRVQYGCLKGKDFWVHAVYDFDVASSSKSFTPGYYLAGLELMAPEALALPEGIELLPPVAAPFERERADLVSRGYDAVTKYSHFQVLFDATAVRAKRSGG